MLYASYYKSPIGNLLIATKNNKIVGLWLENQKYYLSKFKEEIQIDDNLKIITKTKKWLDCYFAKKKPSISDLELDIEGSEFQKLVLQKLINIPYGEISTYKKIATEIAKDKNLKSISSQAVGSAIAHNPISIIIPCHRVIGTNGNLTGYAGGINNKIYLLNHEGVNTTNFSLPKIRKNYENR